jgi:uncharacterized protein (DUF1330 family)
MRTLRAHLSVRALVPVLARAFWEVKKNEKANNGRDRRGVFGAWGWRGDPLHSRPQPGQRYENRVTDEATYNKLLPEVQKIIKEDGGEYVAGGFNKTKLMHGKQAVGNRFVIIRYPNEAAYMKAQGDGLKAWIEKNAPEARDILVEGVEMK